MFETKPFTVVVEGRVQGVGYRAWCADAAVSRGLSGWVRNRKTGAVEAVFFRSVRYRGPICCSIFGVARHLPG